MRLFDADDLRAVLIPLEQKYAGAYADLGAAVGCIVQQIDRFPAVDAVIVTRCKDCDAWKRNVGIVDSPNGHCFEHEIDTNGQDFCSYGEKKGEKSE